MGAPCRPRNFIIHVCLRGDTLHLCFVHVLFLHMAKRPNGRLAQVFTFRQVGIGLTLERHSLAAFFVLEPKRVRRGVGGARWVALFYLGLVLNLILFNLISNIPILLLCQPSLPQPGHRVLWVHCDLLCAHLLPWATSCSPKTAGYQPHQLEAGAGDPVAGRDPLPAPIAYLYEQWRPPELHIVGRALWMTRPTPFAATPRLLPPA